MDIDIQASNINLRLAALAVAIQAGGIKEEQVKRDNGTTVTINRGENGQFASRKGGAASAAKEEKLADTATGKGSGGFNLSKEEDAHLTAYATGPAANALMVSVSEVVADSPGIQKELKKANPKDVEKAEGKNILEKAGNYMKKALKNIAHNLADPKMDLAGAAFLVGLVVACGALAPLAASAGGPVAMAIAASELASGNMAGAALVVGHAKIGQSALKVSMSRKAKPMASMAALAASFATFPLYLAMKKPIHELDKAIRNKVKELFTGDPEPKVTPEADKVMTETVTSPTTNKAKLVAVEEIRKTDPELADAVKDAKLEDIPKAKGKNILEKISNFVKEKQEQASKIVDAHKQDIAYAAAGTVGVIAGVSLAGLAVSAVFGGGALAAITSMSGTMMIGMGGLDIATGNVAGGIISVLAGGGFKALMNQGMLKGNAQIAALLGLAAVRGTNLMINHNKRMEGMRKRDEAFTNELKKETEEWKEERAKKEKYVEDRIEERREKQQTSKEQYLRNREAGATLT